MKYILISALGLLIIIGALLFIGWVPSEKEEATFSDYKDAEYSVAGEIVKLEDGYAEKEIEEGSASQIITRYFGNEVRTDLNDDGKEDVVFLLTQEMGGSGIFYYVVAALAINDGFIGSEAVFIGDRIAPQTTEKGEREGTIIVNYADRAPGEDFSIRPSLGKSLVLLFNAKELRFGELVQDFEGEADPSIMTLPMKAWEWIATEYESKKTEPASRGVFTLTFSEDNTFTTTTDCNNMSGEYIESGKELSFGPIVSTKKYCFGSQENEFASTLEGAHGYYFTSRGELILELDDGGVGTFR